MKEAVHRSPVRFELLTLLIVLIASNAGAATQILLERDAAVPDGEFKGVVELSVAPPADNMKITLSVDGDRIADVLHSPYRVSVDFGPRVVESFAPKGVSYTAYADEASVAAESRDRRALGAGARAVSLAVAPTAAACERCRKSSSRASCASS